MRFCSSSDYHRCVVNVYTCRNIAVSNNVINCLLTAVSLVAMETALLEWPLKTCSVDGLCS